MCLEKIRCDCLILLSSASITKGKQTHFDWPSCHICPMTDSALLSRESEKTKNLSYLSFCYIYTWAAHHVANALKSRLLYGNAVHNRNGFIPWITCHHQVTLEQSRNGADEKCHSGAALFLLSFVTHFIAFGRTSVFEEVDFVLLS